MSDKRVPFHLRDVKNPPSDLDKDQQQEWIRTAMKAKKNYRLKQQYPQFIVPPSIYEVKFVHKNTLSDTMQMLIDHARDCNEYTLDTESEKTDKKLALVQIQTIPSRLPSLVILLELRHLPPKKSSIYMQIKQFLQLVFRSGNTLYSWGSLSEELYPAMIYQLFEWPIQASMFNIQLRFPDWYDWARSSCKVSGPHSQGNVLGNDTQSNTTINTSSKCNCHQPSPYRAGEKWALQQALIYTYGFFLDKSMTLNQWSEDLDPIYSTLSSMKRDKMIRYAIFDCFATTYLGRPVTQYWTFQQAANSDIADLFRASLLPLSQINDNKTNTNINPQAFKNTIDDDIEFISSDDDEILLAQCINNDNEPITMPLLPNDNDNDHEVSVNNHNVVEDVIEEEQQHVPMKSKSRRKQRSTEAQKYRNRKRNNVLRSLRYRYYTTRPMYYRFIMRSVRKILHQHDVYPTHVKEVDGILVIGAKNRAMQQQHQQQLPMNIFDRQHYFEHRRRSRYSEKQGDTIVPSI